MSSGFKTFTDGTVADQTRLLRTFLDGLDVYNDTPDPLIDKYCEKIYSEQVDISQSPMTFRRRARGGRQYAEQNLYRTLNLPLDSYDLEAPFELEFLQDAREEQIRDRMNSAMKGDAQLVKMLFFQACLTKRTAGATGTAYQPSFYSGETDVPGYGENAFSGAHSHYKGINTVTLAAAHVLDPIIDIREHGYGENPGEIDIYFGSTMEDDIMGVLDTNAANTIVQASTPMRQKAIDMGISGANLTIYGANIKIDPYIPAGYFFAVANDVAPVGQREHKDPAVRGLMLFGEHENEDFPLLSKYFLRRTGFSPVRLGAGAARQVVASTTYTNPTFRLL